MNHFTPNKTVQAAAIVAVACLISSLLNHSAAPLAAFVTARWPGLSAVVPRGNSYVQLSSRIYHPASPPSGVTDAGVSAIRMSLCVFALHMIAWSGVVLAVSRLGWPAYWGDGARSRLRDLVIQVWSRSSWLLLILIPLSGFVWACFYEWWRVISLDSIVGLDLGAGALALNWLFVPVADCLFTIFLMSRAVEASVSIEQRRCLSCGYHLTSLSRTKCPECGREEHWPFESKFAVLRVAGAYRKAVLAVAVLVPAAMLFAPVLLPQLRVAWRALSM